MCHPGFAPKLFDITRGQGRHGQRLVGKHATCQTLPVDATSTPTRRELFGALFSWFVVNRMQCIIEKATVFIAISYFEHIFIIIYSYIPLCTLLYIPFIYFYNYILFSCFEYFVYFYHKIETSLFVFTIYIFSKMLVAIKI